MIKILITTTKTTTTTTTTTETETTTTMAMAVAMRLMTIIMIIIMMIMISRTCNYHLVSTFGWLVTAFQNAEECMAFPLWNIFLFVLFVWNY